MKRVKEGPSTRNLARFVWRRNIIPTVQTKWVVGYQRYLIFFWVLVIDSFLFLWFYFSQIFPLRYWRQGKLIYKQLHTNLECYDLKGQLFTSWYTVFVMLFCFIMLYIYNFSVNVLCLLILMNNKHEIWGFWVVFVTIASHNSIISDKLSEMTMYCIDSRKIKEQFPSHWAEHFFKKMKLPFPYEFLVCLTQYLASTEVEQTMEPTLLCLNALLQCTSYPSYRSVALRS